MLTTASMRPAARSATDGGPDAGPAAGAGEANPTSATVIATARAMRRGAVRGVETKPLAIGHPPESPRSTAIECPSSYGNAGKPRRTIMLQFGQKSDRQRAAAEVLELSAVAAPKAAA